MAVQNRPMTCSRCQKDFFGHDGEICPKCRAKEEQAKFDKWLAEITRDKNLEQIVRELARRVYLLENRKSQYAVPPAY